MGSRKPAVAAVIAALALASTVAACGGDDANTDTTSTAASAEQVTVTTGDTADGYSWEVSPTPGADTKSIEYTNNSKEPHALIFARLGEGYTVDEAYELQGRKGSADVVAQTDQKTSPGPGETATVEVTGTLEPGNYILLCPISGKQGPHYKLGQLSEFEIQ
jgi:hypothetical protein